MPKLVFHKKKDKLGSFNLIINKNPIINPQVSVLMSVYNGQNFLRKSIDSILNQIYKNFEFIIINDGSTDNTLEIIMNYINVDNRIIIVDQNNIGLTNSLNRGLNLCRGVYVARQDVDDPSFEYRLEKQLLISRTHKLDCLVSRGIKNLKKTPNLILLNLFNPKSLIFGNIFIHGTYFFKKGINIYNVKHKYAQDFRFMIDILIDKKRVGISSLVVCEIGVHENRITNKYNNDQTESVINALKDSGLNYHYYEFISKIKNESLKKFIFLLLILSSFFISYNIGKLFKINIKNEIRTFLLK